MSTSSQHIRTSTFDSITCDGSYVAFAANTACIEFTVYNATGVAIDIRKGGAGSEFVLPVNGEVTLKGNPADYACKRNSGSGNVVVTAVIYRI